MTVIPTIRPFITGFAVPIGHANQEIFRYDEIRQLSQILIGASWVDAATARAPEPGWTRVTKVQQETTDDD